MDMNKNLTNDTLQISLSGRLDTSTAPAFEEEIKSIGDDVKHLVLDLQQLEYISSAGLRVILSAQKKMSKQGEDMLIKNVSEMVMEIFEVTGFVDILTIE